MTDAMETEASPSAKAGESPSPVSFWAIAGTVMLALAALSAILISIPPHDLWWQLRTGGILATEHHLPTRDRFSFTARGEPWLIQEWLSCLIFYRLQHAFGMDSLVALQVFLIAVAIAGLAIACVRRGANGLFSMTATALAIWAARPWFAIRPQLFTYALLSVSLALLETHRRTKKPEALVALVPLTALWSNLHAGALLAPVLLAFETAGEGAEELQARIAGEPEEGKAWGRFPALAVATLGALLATLLTPHGFAFWSYPRRVTGHPLVTGFITEWFSPNFHAVDLHPLCWLIGLSLAILVWRGLKPPYRDFPLFGFLLAMGLLYRRNLPIFALAACPILAGRAWSLLTEIKGFRRVNWAWVGIVACSISFTPIVGALSRWPRSGWFDAQSGPLDFPTRAVNFLKFHPPVGPLWNEYRWGGYLIWNLPDVPVFIDGRAEVYYRRHVFDDYVRMHRMEPGWEEVLGKYKIRTLLSERWMGISQVLLRDPNWRTVYADQQAIILERRPWER